MFRSSVFAAVLLATAALPVGAQDIATRLLNMENRIRDLTGQVEELNFTVQQLQKQSGARQQSGLVEQPKLKKLQDPAMAESGIETIEDAPAAAPAAKPRKVQQQAIILGAEPIETEDLAPGPTQLGSGENNAAGGDGQILVPDGQQDVAAAPTQNAVVDGAQSADGGMEQVALQPAADTPEALYEKYYETLLRRQFGDAEAGFREFLQKYPDHNLAGSAQYQLGETFYAQGNFQEAARNFLQGYKNYPKSRRAPDSLLKLGLSLRKLDQRDQACAALASVSTEFPRAVEAKKRAQAELKRAGC